MTNVDYRVVMTKEDMAELVLELSTAHTIALDLETTGLSFVSDSIVGWALSTRPNSGFYIPVGHEEKTESSPNDDLPEEFRALLEEISSEPTRRQLDPIYVAETLKPLLENPDVIICIHNKKFDTRFLRNIPIPHTPRDEEHDNRFLPHSGIHLWDNNTHDTILETFVGSEGHLDYLGLKYLALKLFKVKMTEFNELFPPRTRKALKNIAVVDPEVAGMYAAADADICLRIHELFFPRVKDHLIYKLEHQLMPFIQEMEDMGVKADAEYMLSLAAYLADEAAKVRVMIMDQLSDMAGVRLEFSLDSPKQLADVLYNTLKMPAKIFTKKGAVSTGEQAMMGLAKTYPVCANILAYKSMLSTSKNIGATLLESIAPWDGRVHTTYHQWGAKTGRFSSVDPNMANVAVEKKWKILLPGGQEYTISIAPRNAFLAEYDYYFAELDFSAIEFALFAALAGEKMVLAEYAKGKAGDVHVQTAIDLFHVTAEEARDKSRQPTYRDIAKTANYLIIYGGSGNRLSQQTGLSKEEAERDMDKFFEVRPGFRTYTQKTQRQARITRHVSTHFGRRQYIPEYAESSRGAQAKGDRSAVNDIIQTCYVSGTLVYTEGGLIPVEQLVGESFNVWTGLEFVPAYGLKTHVGDIYHVALKGGYALDCVKEQPIQTLNGGGDLEWVNAVDLTPGQLVCVNREVVESGNDYVGWRSTNSFIRSDGALVKKGRANPFEVEYITPDLAELVGRFVADGYWNTRPLLAFHSELEVEDCGFYMDVAERHGIHANRRLSSSDRLPDMGKLQVLTMELPTGWKEFLDSHGCNGVERNIPSFILNGTTEVRAAFLRGVFSGDGGWSNKRIVLTSAHRKSMCEQVQQLLLSLGMRSSIARYATNKEHTNFAYRLSLANSRMFMEVVGFRQAYKNKMPIDYGSEPLPKQLIPRLGKPTTIDLTNSQYGSLHRKSVGYLTAQEIIDKRGLDSSILNYYYVPVESVEILPAQQTYDVATVGERGRLIANGMVVHNTTADIQKMAIIRTRMAVSKRWSRKLARMILQTHDSQLWEIHRSISPYDILPTIIEAMGMQLPGLPKIAVDAKMGISYGTLSESFPHQRKLADGTYEDDFTYDYDAKFTEMWAEREAMKAALPKPRELTFQDEQDEDAEDEAPVRVPRPEVGIQICFYPVLPMLNEQVEQLIEVVSMFPGLNTVKLMIDGEEFPISNHPTSLDEQTLREVLTPIFPNSIIKVDRDSVADALAQELYA